MRRSRRAVSSAARIIDRKITRNFLSKEYYIYDNNNNITHVTTIIILSLLYAYEAVETDRQTSAAAAEPPPPLKRRSRSSRRGDWKKSIGRTRNAHTVELNDGGIMFCSRYFYVMLIGP